MVCLKYENQYTVGSIAFRLHSVVRPWQQYGEKTEDKTDARKDAESAIYTRLWR